VIIVTKLRTGLSGFDSCKGRGRTFSLRHSVQTASGAHSASYRMGTGIKRPGQEAEHSPPSSAEVKNAWSYTSTLPYVFMVWYLVKRKDFILPYLASCWPRFSALRACHSFSVSHESIDRWFSNRLS
jgi:hypothetical protein